MLDLAADPDVDLVVVSVRVDRHFLTVKPSIIAGKDVFVEWPLDRNPAIAKEMAELAKAHDSKTVVGLQASFSPWVRKIKETVDSGTIGRVLSSILIAPLGAGGATLNKNYRYLTDRAVGGNFITIHVAHALEFIISCESYEISRFWSPS
jgi:predicted dehydrogenase